MNSRLLLTYGTLRHLIALILGAMVLSGCGGNSPSSNNKGTAAPSERSLRPGEELTEDAVRFRFVGVYQAVAKVGMWPGARETHCLFLCYEITNVSEGQILSTWLNWYETTASRRLCYLIDEFGNKIRSLEEGVAQLGAKYTPPAGIPRPHKAQEELNPGETQKAYMITEWPKMDKAAQFSVDNCSVPVNAQATRRVDFTLKFSRSDITDVRLDTYTRPDLSGTWRAFEGDRPIDLIRRIVQSESNVATDEISSRSAVKQTGTLRLLEGDGEWEITLSSGSRARLRADDATPKEFTLTTKSEWDEPATKTRFVRIPDTEFDRLKVEWQRDIENTRKQKQEQIANDAARLVGSWTGTLSHTRNAKETLVIAVRIDQLVDPNQPVGEVHYSSSGDRVSLALENNDLGNMASAYGEAGKGPNRLFLLTETSVATQDPKRRPEKRDVKLTLTADGKCLWIGSSKGGQLRGVLIRDAAPDIEDSVTPVVLEQGKPTELGAIRITFRGAYRFGEPDGLWSEVTFIFELANLSATYTVPTRSPLTDVTGEEAYIKPDAGPPVQCYVEYQIGAPSSFSDIDWLNPQQLVLVHYRTPHFKMREEHIERSARLVCEDRVVIDTSGKTRYFRASISSKDIILGEGNPKVNELTRFK